MDIFVLQLRRLLLDYAQDDLYAEWNALYSALTPIHCAAGQRLVSNRGDICFLAKGVLLKTQLETITRIIQADQLIFVPLQSNAIYFHALVPCQLLVLSREELYRIIEVFPRVVRVYDSLLDVWHVQSNERLLLLEMKQKSARIALFKQLHKEACPYMARKDIANYIAVSEEYLRKNF
ncbi:cyclic nucleotide-binding domain-containing protein [Sphingobacterium faecale]|uniref:CRP-like cAMP-binding protein n=1 Tax=Sphingobacterium faecale TaxID=2803775 RepID=A0ABS1QZL5_9SPHI|nr:hypothetical protein [Sphingobacterium faecale]MBL1407227.1 hypothetical protein [Sphingobacterium faecale]